MQKQSIQKWIVQSKKNYKKYVFYENKVLDLSDFIVEHPGGTKVVKDYIYKDITNILFEVYPHHKTSTLARLLKYQVGLLPQEQPTKLCTTPDKKTHIERHYQKIKIYFTSQKQKTILVKGYKHLKQDQINKSLIRSHHQENQNIRESIDKSNGSKNSNNSSKIKKKSFMTSIQVLEQEKKKSYEDQFNQNQQKIRSKEKAKIEMKKQKSQINFNRSCSSQSNEMDESKPNFKVPILFPKKIKINY